MSIAEFMRNLFSTIKSMFFKRVDEVYANKSPLIAYKYVIHTEVEPIEKNGVKIPDKTRNHIRVFEMDHDTQTVVEHRFLYTVVLGEDQQKKNNAIHRLFRLKRWIAHEGADINQASIIYTHAPLGDFFGKNGYSLVVLPE